MRGGAANTFFKSQHLQEHLGVSSAPQHGPSFVRIGKKRRQKELQMVLVPPAVTCERQTPGEGGSNGPIAFCCRREELHQSKRTGWHDRPVFPADEPGLAASGVVQSWPRMCRLCAKGKQPRGGCRVMLVLDETLEIRRELHGGGCTPATSRCSSLLSRSPNAKASKNGSCREPKGEVREGGVHVTDGSSPKKMLWNAYKSCRI